MFVKLLYFLVQFSFIRKLLFETLEDERADIREEVEEALEENAEAIAEGRPLPTAPGSYWGFFIWVLFYSFKPFFST